VPSLTSLGSSMGCQLPEQCPQTIILNTAEQILGITKHNEEDRARGALAITRKCLDLVQAKADCSGFETNTNGQMVCPLQEMTYAVRGMSTGVWPAGQFAVDLAAGVTTVSEIVANNGYGNYL